MTFTGEVHPAAAAWPLMPDDELDALAEDIAANGLTHPIVLDADGVLLDGRCRLEACRRAAVEPTFATVDAEPVAYVLSANQHRRHITQGQRAMAVAKTCSESEHSIRSAAGTAGVGTSAVGRASTVLKFADDLAPLVLDGSLGLDKAYEQAKARKADAESYASKLARLTDDAPDLAAKVRSGDLDLPEALAALAARVAEAARLAANRRMFVSKLVSDPLGVLNTCGRDVVQTHDLGRVAADMAAAGDLDLDDLADVADVLSELHLEVSKHVES